MLSSDQTIGYSINTGSDTVSLYRINFDGTLEPFFRKPDRQISTGDAPRDAALSQNNQHLFVLNNGDGELREFRVRRNGSIRGRDVAPVPTSATGLIAR